jgi:hypothetical protein
MPPKKTSLKLTKANTSKKIKAEETKGGRVKWNFPRNTLEETLRIAYAIKDHNGGNSWETDEVRKSIGAGTGGNAWFYLTAASRDYGLTVGTSSTDKISLSELGREIVFAPNPVIEKKLKTQAFLNIAVFNSVLEYYKGSNLPEMKYLGNTLQKEFQLAPETHEEFSRIFRENCTYLDIKSGPSHTQKNTLDNGEGSIAGPVTVTLAESCENSLTAFVIMPFVERQPEHPLGFFAEVLRSLITPAAKDQFTVRTANRSGSDLIQSTIMNDLINADLVIADLTEHNPNVLFELGVRMAESKPVVLIKAEGTPPLFDVDNMLRVFPYSPNLWQTTIEKDLPALREFIQGAWENRDSEKTYMKILRGMRGATQ